jgi:WD40 repeat protein
MGVLRAEFFPDGKTLVTGALDGKIKLWNLATHQELMTLTVPVGGTFRSLGVSPDGRTLAVGYMTWPGHHVRLFQAPSLPQMARETQDRTKL